MNVGRGLAPAVVGGGNFDDPKKAFSISEKVPPKGADEVEKRDSRLLCSLHLISLLRRQLLLKEKP